MLAKELGEHVSAEEFFAYTYAVLSAPAYGSSASAATKSSKVGLAAG